VPKAPDERDQYRTPADLEAAIRALETDMRAAAANLEFERAATIRDRLRRLRNPDLVAEAPRGAA
jgi:excinuclease ABC subunit B